MAKHTEKVAIITGGSSGMGLATARLLLEEGARVAIVARGKEGLASATRDLRGGNRLLAIDCDIAKIDALTACVEEVTGAFGRIDILFANAGIGLFQTPEAVTEDDFDKLVEVNFKGTFFTIQKSLPALNDGASDILNASWTLHRAMADCSVYSATKAAVHNLARTFAVALVSRRIRVNSISPGFINTGQFNEEKLGKEAADKYKAHVPLGAFGTVEDIARAVSFLASIEAAYITGQDYLLDGGMVSAFLP